MRAADVGCGEAVIEGFLDGLLHQSGEVGPAASEWSSIMEIERIMPTGLAIPLPAMSGADPEVLS